MEAKEIKINETNFKFVQLTDYCKGSEHILIRSETKRKMYYQRIFFTDDTRNWTKSSCFEFISTVNFIGNCYIPAFIRNYLQTAWILVKEKGRRFENIEYDSEDIKLLLSFAGSSLFDYINLTESLLLATRCQALIQTFYQAFGEERKNNFKTLLKILISREGELEKYDFSSKNTIIPIYKRSRYSVCSLLDDLIKDNAKILMSEDLLGTYKNISVSFNDIKEKEEWSNIVGLLGNKTRANLSISVNQRVEVDIPKNDFGIDSKYLANFKKSYCIIKDGILWQKRLAVKVSKKLETKLRRYNGLVTDNLLMDGEILLDLSKLPIVSKSKIHSFSINNLSELAAKEKLSHFAIEYLEYISDNSSRVTDKELFLSSFGIDKYGNYSPYTINRKSEIDNYYVSTINSRFIDNSGFGLSKTKRKYYYDLIRHNLYSKGSNSVFYNISEFLFKQVIPKLTTENINEQKNNWIEENKKINKQLRSEIFKLIMTKNLKFDHNNSKIKQKILYNNSKISVSVYGVEDIVVTWTIDRSKIEYTKKINKFKKA